MAEKRDIQELVREVLSTLDTPGEEQHPKEGVEETPETPPVEGEDAQHYYLVTREELESLANPQPEPTVIEAGITVPSDAATIPTPPVPETVEKQEPEQEKTVP